MLSDLLEHALDAWSSPFCYALSAVVLASIGVGLIETTSNSVREVAGLWAGSLLIAEEVGEEALHERAELGRGTHCSPPDDAYARNSDQSPGLAVIRMECVGAQRSRDESGRGDFNWGAASLRDR